MPNQRRGYSAKKGAFWIQLIWTHPEPRKKQEHTPHMGVHAHINIPIPITQPLTQKHTPSHANSPLSPHTIPLRASKPCFQHTASQLLRKVLGDTQMTPKSLGHKAERKCSISRAFQCTCNLIYSSSKLAFRSKITQVGHTRSEGDDNDCPSLCTGHDSRTCRGLIPMSCQCYNVFPLIIHTGQPWMSVRPWQTSHIHLQVFYSSCNKSGNSFWIAYRSTSNRKGNVNCQLRRNSFSLLVGWKVL